MKLPFFQPIWQVLPWIMSLRWGAQDSKSIYCFWSRHYRTLRNFALLSLQCNVYTPSVQANQTIKNRGLGSVFFFFLLHAPNINTTICSSPHLQKCSINGLLGYIAHLFPITALQKITFFPKSDAGMDNLTALFPGDPGWRSWNVFWTALRPSFSDWH